MVGVLQRLVRKAGQSEVIEMLPVLQNFPLGLDQQLHTVFPLHNSPKPYNNRKREGKEEIYFGEKA